MTGENFLQDEDREFLERKGWEYEVKAVSHPEGQELLITILNFSMPAKYLPGKVDLLVRQFPKYPEVGMDMFWTKPDVTLAEGGQTPQAAEVHEENPGMEWQRWSRHTTWRPNKDNLETFMGAILNELNK